MTPRDPERIYTPKADETAGLALFAQREAAPEVARPVPTAHAPGAGQQARTEARASARSRIAETYRRIALSLEGHGPQTRKELAETTGENVNTINARVSEMRGFLTAWQVCGRVGPVPEFACHTDGRRGGESVVHLSRLTLTGGSHA